MAHRIQGWYLVRVPGQKVFDFTDAVVSNSKYDCTTFLEHLSRDGFVLKKKALIVEQITSRTFLVQKK